MSVLIFEGRVILYYSDVVCDVVYEVFVGIYYHRRDRFLIFVISYRYDYMNGFWSI